MEVIINCALAKDVLTNMVQKNKLQKKTSCNMFLLQISQKCFYNCHYHLIKTIEYNIFC